MGITSALQKNEVTTICNPPVNDYPNRSRTKITEPNSLPELRGDDGLEDIDHFASFMRSLKAPARDETAAATPEAKNGEDFSSRSAAPLSVGRL